jgi:hypothetical protein
VASIITLTREENHNASAFFIIERNKLGKQEIDVDN